jgi:hypothetical protein
MRAKGKTLLLLMTSLAGLDLPAVSGQHAIQLVSPSGGLTLQSLPPAVPAALRPDLKVSWHGGKLTVQADRVPLEIVLGAVMGRTGVEIRGLEKVHGKKISARFSDVDLQSGLDSLLVHLDYALEASTSRAGGTRFRVLILGQRDPGEGGGLAEVAEAGGLSVRSVNSDRGSTIGAQDAKAAGETHRADVEDLRKALLDADPMVRAAAAQALAGEDPATAAEAVAGLPEGQKAALSKLQALQQLTQNGQADGQAVLSALADALKDTDPALRSFAVQALADRGDAQAVGYLREAFRDLDVAGRMLALESVGQKDGAQQILEDATQDSDENVRTTATELLKQLGSANAENEPGAK